MSNVLNHFPKSTQPAVTADLRNISHAATRAEALAAIETFKEKYAAKYAKGVACLTKDADALLAFYGLRPFLPQTVHWTVCRFADRRELPAEHWDHLRTSNPIESVRTGPRTDGGRGPHSPRSGTVLPGPRVRSRKRPRG